MTTTIDTTIPQQGHFAFRSIQAVATAKLAETGQATVQDTAGCGSVQFLVGQERLGPVFSQDTEGTYLCGRPDAVIRPGPSAAGASRPQGLPGRRRCRGAPDRPGFVVL